jgi:GrpB-like predicted nucleotidyltransferase (UPF0157 family)
VRVSASGWVLPDDRHRISLTPVTVSGSRIVEVQPYDERWAERGAELAAQLRATLGPLALRVEHIGSTSVPGMAAKPVYDMQASVRNLAAAAEAFDEPLAAIGLTRTPYEADHVPPGRLDPPERWAKRLWAGVVAFATTPAAGVGGRQAREWVNLHARVAGSPNERLALLFRDWFRAHPQAVPAYGDFKVRLADAVAALGTYTEVKDPVVDLINVTAEAWADRTGWKP